MCLYIKRTGHKEPGDTIEQDENGNYIAYKVLKESHGKLYSIYRDVRYNSGAIDSGRSSELTPKELSYKQIGQGIHLYTNPAAVLEEMDDWPNPVVFRVTVLKEDLVAFGEFLWENDCLVATKINIDLGKDRITREEVEALA